MTDNNNSYSDLQAFTNDHQWTDLTNKTN